MSKSTNASVKSNTTKHRRIFRGIKRHRHHSPAFIGIGDGFVHFSTLSQYIIDRVTRGKKSSQSLPIVDVADLIFSNASKIEMSLTRTKLSTSSLNTLRLASRLMLSPVSIKRFNL